MTRIRKLITLAGDLRAAARHLRHRRAEKGTAA